MPRFNRFSLSRKQRQAAVEQFIEVVNIARNKKEAEVICKDLFSESEMIMFMRRIQAAGLLKKGWSMERIARELKASTNLVQGVSSHLARGGHGYQLIIKRLDQLMEARQKSSSDEPKSRPPYWTGGFWWSLGR